MAAIIFTALLLMTQTCHVTAGGSGDRDASGVFTTREQHQRQTTAAPGAQTEGDTGYDYNEAYDDEFDEDSGREPTFDVPIVNVTVVAGQTAVLPCSIDHLGSYKVVWLDQDGIPLTYEDRRMIDDFRFSIVRPYIKEWNLQVREIKWEDQGVYRCTINTPTIKSKSVMLHVKVPARIIDELSSDDVTVQEGDTVVLICNVTGVPHPEVTWYRRPASSKLSMREKIGMTGEMIIIQNVSRYCDDIYECVASNNVPPAVSRQMRVTVEFAPEITMPNRRIGQYLGKDTILECVITAFPHAVNYWEKDSKRMTGNTKHRIEAYDEGAHTITLSLRIHDVASEDFGQYRCVAANSLGSDAEAMYLYEYEDRNHKQSTTYHHGHFDGTRPTPDALATPTRGYKDPTYKHDKGSSHNSVDKTGPGNPGGLMSSGPGAVVAASKLHHVISCVALCLAVTIGRPWGMAHV